MLRIAYFFRGLLLVAATSGCVTRHWVAKEVVGQVLDSDSRLPLAHVVIYRRIHEDRTLVGESDSAGRFHIPARRDARFEVPMGDPAHPARLEFVFDGYVDSSISCGTITGDVSSAKAPVIDGVIVEMKKKPNQPPEPTVMLVTPRAEARVAPSTTVAHL